MEQIQLRKTKKVIPYYILYVQLKMWIWKSTLLVLMLKISINNLFITLLSELNIFNFTILHVK